MPAPNFQEFKDMPQNAGKEFDQLELEYLRFKAVANAQKAPVAEAQKPPEKGIIDTAGDIVSGLPRLPGRVAGMGLGVAAGLLPSNWDDISKEYSSFTAIIEKDLGKDWLENWTNNLGDLQESTIHLLATAAGYTPQRKDEGVVEHGFKVGKQLTAGAIGGTAAIIMNPIDAVYSRPADVAGFMASGLLKLRARARMGDVRAKYALDKIGADKGKSGRGTGMSLLRTLADKPLPGIPGMGRRPVKRVPLEVGAAEATAAEFRILNKESTPSSVVKKPIEALEGQAPLTVGDLTDSLLSGAAGGLPFGTLEPALYAPLARYLWGVAEGTPAFQSATGKIRRFFSSPAAQTLLADEQQVRQVMRERHKFRALINREGDTLIQKSKNLTAADYPSVFQMRGDSPVYELRKGESTLTHPTQRAVQESQAQIHKIADPEIQRRKLGIQPGDKTPISRIMTRREEVAKLADIERKPVEVRIADLGKEGGRAIRNIQSLMDNVRLGKARQLEFQASVFDAMQDGSSLLMSESLRNKLVSHVLDQMKPGAAESARIAGALQKSLMEKFQKPIRVVGEQGKEVFARSEPGMLRLENGVNISLSNAMEATLKGMKEKDIANIRAEVISRIIRQASDEASRAAFQKAMKQEARRRAHAGVDEALRTGKGSISAASYADGMVLGHAIEGKPMNQVLPRGMSPTKIAESVRAQRVSALAEASKRAGRELTPNEISTISTRIDDMANRLEKYEEFADKTNMLLPDEDLFPNARIEHEMANMDGSNMSFKPDAMYVSPGFNATVGWNQLSRASEGPLFDALSSFTTFIKGNLTVHNPMTHIGNYTSNVGLVSLIQGRTPLRVVLETTNAARKYINYKAGREVSRMDKRTFRALDTTKIATSDLIHAELGVMESLGAAEVVPHLRTFTDKVQAPVKAVWNKYDSAMKEGYKWGDQSFKLYESSRGFQELAHAVDSLANGEYMRFQTSPTAYTTIHKSNGKMRRAKEVLAPEQLDRILASVAAKRAMDLFVDYSQVPGMLILLRRMSILSVASPFITWFWRAQDMPGKKGLIYRTLVDEPLYDTNSPSLLRSNTMSSLYLQARRSMIYQGGRKTLHEEREFMRELTKYMDQPHGRGLFFDSDNPGYFTYMRLNNTDFFAPGMHAMRIFSGAIAKRLQAQDYDSLSETQKRLVNRFARGEVGTAKDILSMAGVAGGPIVETMTMAITERNRFGRPLVEGEMLKSLMPVVMGQLPYKAVDVALNSLGVWDAGSILSQRFYSQSPRDPNESEDFGPWAFRTLIGLGWREASAAGKTQSFIRRVKSEMVTSMNGAANKKAKQYRKLGMDEEADELMELTSSNLDRINFEAEQMWAEADDLEKALQHSEGVRIDDDEDESALEGFE